MPTPKRKNPQDTTLRNTRAANKRIAQLEADVALLNGQMSVVLAVIRESGIAKSFVNVGKRR